MTTHFSTGPFIGPVNILVDLTAAQIAAPTSDMISDLDVTYRLNVAPYTRYRSDGTALVAVLSSGGGTIAGPLTITNTPVLTTGGVKATSTVNDPAGETIPSEWITNFNIFSDNSQDVLGSAFRLYINTFGHTQSSQHTSAVYATNTPFGGTGGTVTFAPAIIGSSGVQSANTVINAIAFKARALIRNSGGTVINSFAGYQERSNPADATNLYGLVITDPSGFGQFVYGGTLPTAMVDIKAYDNLAATALLQTQNNSGAVGLLVTADGSASVPTQTPASASAPGRAGTITWDASFAYVCVSANSWKRVAISTW